MVVDGEKKWEMSQLLFTDSTMLVANNKKKLVDEFDRVCRGRKLKVNIVKNKVMRSARDDIVGEKNIMVDGLLMEEVDFFKYLG